MSGEKKNMAPGLKKLPPLQNIPSQSNMDFDPAQFYQEESTIISSLDSFQGLQQLQQSKQNEQQAPISAMSSPPPLKTPPSPFAAPQALQNSPQLQSLPQNPPQLQSLPQNPPQLQSLPQNPPQIQSMPSVNMSGPKTLSPFSANAFNLNPPTPPLESVPNQVIIPEQSIQTHQSSTATATATPKKARERLRELSSETSIARLSDFTDGTDRKAHSQMIVCFAPRGGVGATSSAINIAANLVAQNRKVVIVDMELQLGAVCTSLNLRPNRSIAELVMETLDQKGPITSALDQHSSGMTVLAQEDRINELSVITTDRLPRLFDALGCAFEYIIVDGLKSFSDHAVATMDLAHKIFLFTTQDIPSIKSSTKVYRLLRKLGYPENKVNIVINRYQEKSEYPLEIIENYIGGAVQHTIHNDFPFVSQALSEGLLFNQINPQHQVSIDVANIANDLMGLPAIKKNTSFFSKLFRRS